MPGKYYAKHTLNHFSDNQDKKNKLNDNFRNFIIEQAIAHLKNSDDDIDKKVAYLKDQTHDVFRYGRKYRYDCSLSNYHIEKIIRNIGDEDLYHAYFGKTFQEADNQNAIIVFVIIAVIIFLFVVFTIK